MLNLIKSDESEYIQDRCNTEINLQSLINTKAFYGTSCDSWDPKTAPFILSTKVNRHPRKKGRSKYTYLIDLTLTVKAWNRSKQFIEQLSANSGNFLVVGTQNEISPLIKHYAKQIPTYHVTRKWKGGTLTNLKVTLASIKRLENLEKIINKLENQEDPNFTINKKELGLLKKELIKLEDQYGGLRGLKELPQALIVFDMVSHKTAVYEAQKLNIPVICISNTLSNPDYAEYFIPSNTSSPATLKLFVFNIFAALEIGYKKKEFKYHQQQLANELNNLDEDINLQVSITATDIPVTYKKK